jgi:hypothetical protein
MPNSIFSALLAVLSAGALFASRVEAHAAPVISLDDGKFLGATSGPIDLFLGIPFAKPP